MTTPLYKVTSVTVSSRAVGVGKFSFPMVRRVFPTLIANELVSVQPMTAPTSLLFYTDYTYGKHKPTVPQPPKQQRNHARKKH